jgi:glucan 1,3-beta-glucosidase
MAWGSKFADIQNPRPMIQIGVPGDVGMYFQPEIGSYSCLTRFILLGLAQMSDFILGIKTASPGLVLLEINMAGAKPGDVGFFNVHFPLNMGGTITKPRTCSSAANCPSNHISVNMTPSSSVYWENTWVSDAVAVNMVPVMEEASLSSRRVEPGLMELDLVSLNPRKRGNTLFANPHVGVFRHEVSC